MHWSIQKIPALESIAVICKLRLYLLRDQASLCQGAKRTKVGAVMNAAAA